MYFFYGEGAKRISLKFLVGSVKSVYLLFYISTKPVILKTGKTHSKPRKDLKKVASIL